MVSIFAIFWLITFVIFMIGLIRPNLVIKWGKKRNRIRVIVTYIPLMFLFLLGIGITAPEVDQPSSTVSINDIEESSINMEILKENKQEMVKKAEIIKLQKEILSNEAEETAEEAPPEGSVEGESTINNEETTDKGKEESFFAKLLNRDVEEQVLEEVNREEQSEKTPSEAKTPWWKLWGKKGEDNQEEENLFKEAVKLGNVTKVKELLENGEDVNQVLYKFNKQNALASAADDGNLPLVELLLEYKADPNIKTRFTSTPIYLATINGHTDVAKRLLEVSADPNIKASKINLEYSPLTFAAKEGYYEIVDLLIKNGADLESKTIFGQTALHFASADNLNIARILLNSGVDPNPQDSYGITPFMDAAVNNQINIMVLLLNYGADMTMVDNNGADALFNSVVAGNYEATSFLLEKGARPSGNISVDKYHIAAKISGNEDIEVLLQSYF